MTTPVATMSIGYKKIERWVRDQQAAGNNIRWEGWNLVFLFPRPQAEFMPQGAYQNGVWGLPTTVEVNSEGKYEIPLRSAIKNVRRGN